MASSAFIKIGQPLPATGSCTGRSPDQLEAAYKLQQQEREKGMGAGQANAMDPGQPAMDQSKMAVKPDCGEGTYRGSGKLLGKVAIVTGGDSGIGRAVCIAMAREGAAVVCNYRSHDVDAAATLAACQSPQPTVLLPGHTTASLPSYPTGPCVLHKADIGSKQACTNLVAEAVNRYGRVDILVHNAAIQFPESPYDGSVSAHMQDVFQVNVFALSWLTEAALPTMRAQGSGAIIANSSVNAYKGNTNLISYASSKGALTDLCRSYATALASDGIRVNAVAPGPIWTPFITATFDSKEKIQEFGKQTALGRAGQPAEVAPAFVFLASNDASFITGQAIHVNGGQLTGS